MTLDVDALSAVRDRHAGWGLLRYDHAPLVLGLLQRVFVARNLRSVRQPDLIEALEDDLHALRSVHGDRAAPRSASDYLTEWSSDERGWLRRFYPLEGDEPMFDMTPEAEQAVGWVTRLVDRPFVGTESRLRSLFDLLEQMAQSIETDPARRLEDLERRRAAIDAEIARVHAGDLDVIDDRALKERFQQFVVLARELLGDFRQVEHNFRALDRRVREQITAWQGAKGALIGDILGERDAIDESDEGQSFKAFWEFLMSASRQEQMTSNLERVLEQPAVVDLQPDRRIRRVHYDWLDAGEHTQRTVALLSTQLRRFLDDAAWLEDRRIIEILHSIEASALAVRDEPPPGVVMDVSVAGVAISLPFERPLFVPKARIAIDDAVTLTEEDHVDLDDLFAHDVVDLERLVLHIEHHLFADRQVTLADLCSSMPLQHGLAELVAYLHLGTDRFTTIVDEAVTDTVMWMNAGTQRSASLPRVVFVA